MSAALAKRDAHVAAIADAERSQALADASAARTWPIGVHLTPFAPGCEQLRIDDRRRWRTFYGRTVEEALRSTLSLLRLSPSACSAAQEGTDTVLLAAVRPELLKLVSSEPGAVVPHALFWDGASLDQLQTAIADLTGRGWKPSALLEAA